MRSHVTDDFRECYRKLPQNVRLDTRDAYRTFKNDPFTTSLHFKEVYRDNKKRVWSVRTNLGYRALGVRVKDDEIVWYWLGPHAEYDEIFRRFKKMSAPKQAGQ